MSADRKPQLREDVLTRRKALAPDVAAAAAGRMAGNFMQQIPLAKHAVAAGYRPIRGEIDVTLLLARLQVHGLETALPVVKKKGEALAFRRWKPGDSLIPGDYGIEVPPEAAAVIVPDLVIVPLLAFDGRGCRLGYGHGYYDRTLSELRSVNPKVLAVGVAYKVQAVPSVPSVDTDEPLDAVVTEDGAFFFSKAKRS